MYMKADKTWTVIRHSGRGGKPTRVAYRGDEVGAWAFFTRMSKDIKQGSVLLIDHAGGLQAYRWSSKNDKG